MTFFSLRRVHFYVLNKAEIHVSCRSFLKTLVTALLCCYTEVIGKEASLCVTASYCESIKPIGWVHIHCFLVTAKEKGVNSQDKNAKARGVWTVTRVQWLIRMKKSRRKLHPQIHIPYWSYQIVSCFLSLSDTITIIFLSLSVCVGVLHRGLDLVNIHLFHDASNLIACNSSPSIYSANRKNALRYVINRSDLQIHSYAKSVQDDKKWGKKKNPT